MPFSTTDFKPPGEPPLSSGYHDVHGSAKGMSTVTLNPVTMDSYMGNLGFDISVEPCQEVKWISYFDVAVTKVSENKVQREISSLDFYINYQILQLPLFFS